MSGEGGFAPGNNNGFAPGNGAGGLALRGWLVPVAAALALVASLGTAGENTDIGAHFFGLVCGCALGGGLGLLALRHGRPDEWGQGRASPACGVLAGLLVAAAWAWAWISGWPLS